MAVSLSSITAKSPTSAACVEPAIRYTLAASPDGQVTELADETATGLAPPRLGALPAAFLCTTRPVRPYLFSLSCAAHHCGSNRPDAADNVCPGAGWHHTASRGVTARHTAGRRVHAAASGAHHREPG